MPDLPRRWVPVRMLALASSVRGRTHRPLSCSARVLVRNYINDSRGLFVKINAIERVVRGLCCMTPEQAQTITDVILRERFQNILELGFYQGVSTCYIAGA